ncbi:MAG: membrane protein insertase YidC [Ignavibacteriales bacterium]|nr:membrane protein insertase YidC [Ignavibacteriales bacterium]
MDKQSTLAFILIGIILVFWLYLNSPQPPVDQPHKEDTTKVVVNSDTLKLEDKAQTEVAEKESTEVQTTFNKSEKKEETITIETDLALIELTSKGGRLKKFYLKKYETWYHDNIDSTDIYNRYVQLINYTKEGGDFNIVFVTKEGQFVNTKNIDFNSDKKESYYRVKENDSLSLSYTYNVEENKSLTKQFTFFANDYNSKVQIILNNLDDVISSYRYDLEWSNGINFVEQNSVDEANYSSAAAFSGDEKVVIDATSVDEPVEKVINGKIDWVGVKNKYFTVILAPVNPSDEGGADFKGEHVLNQFGNREYYSTSLRIPFNNQKLQKDNFRLYVGPLDYDILKAQNHNYQAIYDFGSFFGLAFITRPISEYILHPLFIFLHKFIPNYGWVIIVFTIILKIALSPLTRQSYKSMKKMSQLQPKIAELKEKFKGDQQKIQKETMKLYSTYGINPAGGCLPMLLQMPILFALFTFFNVAIEIRHEPFLWWITNLSSPDVIYKLPFKIPLFGVDIITGLAPLLGLTMFFTQKMTVKDPSQKAMVYIMPFMMTFIFMNLSSGLNLYYFMFNLLSIGQQYYINHKQGEELVPVENPKKKTGFMQRMMEAAEQQQKAQKQMGKKK